MFSNIVAYKFHLHNRTQKEFKHFNSIVSEHFTHFNNKTTFSHSLRFATHSENHTANLRRTNRPHQQHEHAQQQNRKTRLDWQMRLPRTESDPSGGWIWQTRGSSSQEAEEGLRDVRGLQEAHLREARTRAILINFRYFFKRRFDCTKEGDAAGFENPRQDKVT